MKLCINCRYFVHVASDVSGCAHPNIAVNLVTGEKQPRDAQRMRDTDGPCGPEGRLFEGKDIADGAGTGCRRMMNLALAFERVAEGPIVAAVIGDDNRQPLVECANHPLFGKVVSWAEARLVLDYELDADWGGSHHDVYAWTETQVLFINEENGFIRIAQVPRNPVPCEPSANGWWE